MAFYKKYIVKMQDSLTGRWYVHQQCVSPYWAKKAAEDLLGFVRWTRVYNGLWHAYNREGQKLAVVEERII